MEGRRSPFVLANYRQMRRPEAECCLSGSRITPLRCFLSMEKWVKFCLSPHGNPRGDSRRPLATTHPHFSSTESHSFPSNSCSWPGSRVPGPWNGRCGVSSLLLLCSCGYKTMQTSGALERFGGLGWGQRARKQACSHPKCQVQ